jgi:hypothetical protein
MAAARCELPSREGLVIEQGNPGRGGILPGLPGEPRGSDDGCDLRPVHCVAGPAEASAIPVNS